MAKTMKTEDISEAVLAQIIRDSLKVHAPTMNMDRFNKIVKTLAHVVFLHVTSYRKEDEDNE